MASKIYIVKQVNKKWVVQREDAKAPSGRFDTKPEAVARGKEVATKVKGELHVMKVDGTLQDKRSFAAAAAPKPAAKKPAAKKPVAKKTVAKKTTAKKPAAKKPVAKKTTAKKPATAKKTVAKKPAAAKKTVAKKPVAAKKPATRKPAAKKTTTRTKK